MWVQQSAEILGLEYLEIYGKIHYLFMGYNS